MGSFLRFLPADVCASMTRIVRTCFGLEFPKIPMEDFELEAATWWVAMGVKGFVVQAAALAAQAVVI